MFLLSALGIEGANDIDHSRPLQIGDFQLSAEAATEAARILNGGEFDNRVNITPKAIDEHFYWSVRHQAEGSGEIFAFPDWSKPFPTALELGIVRALAALPPERHGDILSGGYQIAVGSPVGLAAFQKVVAATTRPLVGKSILFSGGCHVIAHEKCNDLLNETARHCIENSFRTAPLKFRFLELYRIMEARFLADIKHKLLSTFDNEPQAALDEAVDSLKSEINQIVGLAESQTNLFEECWSAFDTLKNDNRLVAALFRKIRLRHQALSGVRWKVGAALIYLLRCAIVHAGQKDIIFESFQDGELAVSEVILSVEKAALALVGFEIQHDVECY